MTFLAGRSGCVLRTFLVEGLYTLSEYEYEYIRDTVIKSKVPS